MDVGNNILIQIPRNIFTLAIVISIVGLQACNSKWTGSKNSYQYYLDASPHIIDLTLDLKSNKTFNFKNQTLYCNNYLRGTYQIDQDTLLLKVTNPINYGGPLNYDIEYIDNKNPGERYIQVISSISLCKEAFPTVLLNYNDGIRANWVSGTDCSSIFSIPDSIEIVKVGVPMVTEYEDYLEIQLDNPTNKSLKIKVNSMPFIICKIPQLSKWLIKNDTLFPIIEGRRITDTPLVKVH